MAIFPYYVSAADPDTVLSTAEAEPQPGDVTLETASEDAQTTYTDIKVADRYGDAPLWEYFVSPLGGLVHQVYLDANDYDEVSVKDSPDSDWFKTRSTPEQFTTAQILRQQELLVRDSLNNPDAANILGNMSVLGGPIEPATTDDQAGGSFLDSLSNLFGGGISTKTLLIIGLIAVAFIVLIVLVK